MSVVVLRFEEWMLRELAELIKAAHAESPLMSAFNFSETRVENMIGHAIFAPDRVCGFAAAEMDDRKIIGLIIGSVSGICWSDELIANDLITYIAPTFREGALTQQLLEAYAKWATKLGATKLFFGRTAEAAPTDYDFEGWTRVGAQLMKVA